MADTTPAGKDLMALRNVLAVQINPATEETVAGLSTQASSFAGLAIPQSDSVYATYPSESSEVYTFKLSGVTTATVTVTYTNSTKDVLTSAVIAIV